MGDVLSVLSNVAFLLPSVQSVYLRHWTRAVLYFFMIFASSFYHACNTWAGHCVLDARTHCKLDFFFAQLLIPVTALYIIKFKGAWCFLERVLIMFTALVLFIVESVSDEPFIIQGIIAGASFGAIVVYWIGYAIYTKHTEGRARIPRYDWSAMTKAVVCTTFACILFVTQRQSHTSYQWIHSVWHVLAAFGQYWVLQTRPERGPIYPVLDKKISRKIKPDHDA